MSTRLQIRRDTAANWILANPTLFEGELGLETDTSKIKIGDGVTAWISLPAKDAADVVVVTNDSAATATVTPLLSLTKTSSGTPDIGLGVEQDFNIESTGGIVKSMSIKSQLVSANGDECKTIFSNRTIGSEVPVITLKGRNLGVGTEDPTSQIDAVSPDKNDLAVMQIRNTGSGPTTAGAGGVIIQATNQGGDSVLISVANDGSASAYYIYPKKAIISTTAGVPLVFNTNATDNEHLVLSADGNTSVSGFLKIGGSAPSGATVPSIKNAVYTLTTAASAGSASVAHGLDVSKILSVNPILHYSGFYIPPFMTHDAVNHYEWYMDSDNIYVIVDAGSTSCFDAPVTIMVQYKS